MAKGLLGGYTSGLGSFAYLPKSMILGSSDLPSPDYGSAPLDPNTSQLLDHAVAVANQSPEELASKYNSGQEEAKGLLGSGNDSARSESLGMTSDPATQQAINARAAKSLNSDINKIQKQNQYDSYGRLSDKTQSGLGPLTASYHVQQQMDSDAYSNSISRYKARQQIMANVFGSVGSLAGKYAGSRAIQKAGNTSGSRQDDGGSLSDNGSSGGGGFGGRYSSAPMEQMGDY